MSFKKCKVVMLPTNQESNIHSYMYELGLTKKSKKTYQMNGNNQISYAQHLYIISDDEIKEGDWYIDDIGTVRQSITSDKDYWAVRQNYKKIIATTDSSLQYHDKTPIGENVNGLWKCLPQPSQSFIQKYVEEYNKGNVITDVMVEYEWYLNSATDFNVWTKLENQNITEEIKNFYTEKRLQPFLKINSKDNTITIKKVKDTWDKEEVISNIEKYRIDYEKYKRSCHFGPNEKEIKEWTIEWIEKNL